MSEQITVNQHYVPRFYMKPFSTIVNEGTKRKYSYEQRRALLCRVYRKPDFISDVKEASRWKKAQEYSKVLLDYLDYYWKTPKEDRVISGEYMNVTSYRLQK